MSHLPVKFKQKPSIYNSRERIKIFEVFEEGNLVNSYDEIGVIVKINKQFPAIHVKFSNILVIVYTVADIGKRIFPMRG